LIITFWHKQTLQERHYYHCTTNPQSQTNLRITAFDGHSSPDSLCYGGYTTRAAHQVLLIWLQPLLVHWKQLEISSKSTVEPLELQAWAAGKMPRQGMGTCLARQSEWQPRQSAAPGLSLKAHPFTEFLAPHSSPWCVRVSSHMTGQLLC